VCVVRTCVTAGGYLAARRTELVTNRAASDASLTVTTLPTRIQQATTQLLKQSCRTLDKLFRGS